MDNMSYLNWEGKGVCFQKIQELLSNQTVWMHKRSNEEIAITPAHDLTQKHDLYNIPIEFLLFP